MFSIDATSNKKYFIILKNNKEFVRVSKAVNTLEQVKSYFQIGLVKEHSMTSKEALETLFASYHYDGNYQQVIEAREKLEKDLEHLGKLEKALDILKDKYYIELFDDRLFILINNLKDLTQKEYELLKEVLGNE